MSSPRRSRRRLPWQMRSRIFYLLSEGMTAAEILRDPAVSSGAESQGISLTSDDVKAVLRSAEYRRYMAKVSVDAESRTAEKIASAVLENAGAFGQTADIARYELARLLRELIDETARYQHEDLPFPEKIKAVRALSQSFAAIQAPSLERKLAARDAGIAKLQALLALRDAEIRRLRSLAGAGNDEKVIEVMNRKVGLEVSHEIPALSEEMDPGRVSDQTV